jgi:hypothetical protein
MTVICGASTAGKSTQPAQAGCGHVDAACASLAACKPRRMDGPAARRARARQHRSGRCRGGGGRPSALCREFPAGRGSGKRTASTPTDACPRSSRVRRQAEADGFLVDEMSRVILSGYRCAWPRRAECFGKQNTLGGVRRNRRQSRSTSCPPIMASSRSPSRGLLVRCTTLP